MMRLNLLVISLILFFTGITHALAKPLPENLQVIGQAELKVLWFKVYSARLESLAGRYDAAISPLVLHLDYQRDISRQQLLDETASQWQRAKVNPADQARWLASLAQIWPDIRQQDSLSFYQASDGGHFYHNQRYIGSIKDAGFSQTFLSIWLADNSDFPQLTRALTGKQ
ncbi:hypothetical protein [Amphritea sp.]|uniref:hypothetical protein n=1 Tax=Amphritea sp. TaxID=1872502 RepID=UPI003A8EDF35